MCVACVCTYMRVGNDQDMTNKVQNKCTTVNHRRQSYSSKMNDLTSENMDQLAKVQKNQDNTVGHPKTSCRY